MTKIRIGSTRKKIGKDGAFSLKHIDRNIDIKKADHIDEERVHLNDYWRNEKLGDINAGSQEDYIKSVYKKCFSKYIEKTNEKAIKSRHKERMIDVDKMLSKKRTAPEGTLLYFGDKNYYANREDHIAMRDEYIAKHNELYPNMPIICAETHCDERGAIHSSLWQIYIATDADGDLHYHQTDALKEAGFKNQNDRYKNAKADYTKKTREMIIEIAESRGYEIEKTARDNGGKSLEEYQREQAKKEYEAMKAFIVSDKQVQKSIKDAKRDRKGNYILTAEEMKNIARLALMKMQVNRYQDFLNNSTVAENERSEYKNKINSLEKEIDRVIAMKDERFDFVFDWLKERGLLEEMQRDFREKKEREKLMCEMKRENTIFRTYMHDSQDYDLTL